MNKGFRLGRLGRLGRLVISVPPPVFAFNPVSGQCVPQIYGGCRGNGNKFSTKQECEAFCRAKPRNMKHRNEFKEFKHKKQAKQSIGVSLFEEIQSEVPDIWQSGDGKELQAEVFFY